MEIEISDKTIITLDAINMEFDKLPYVDKEACVIYLMKKLARESGEGIEYFDKLRLLARFIWYRNETKKEAEDED